MPPQQQNLIYLPPGVMPPVQQLPAPPIATGIPFDKAFFAELLPQAVANFCAQVTCDHPIMELMTVDGTTHFINGVSGVADTWVALHTSRKEHDHPIQVFIPYQTIFRVELHPCSGDRENRLGFNLHPANAPVVMTATVEPVAAPIEPPPAEVQPADAAVVSKNRKRSK